MFLNSCIMVLELGLRVKYNFWNLTIFHRSPVVVTCRVRKLKRHLPTGGTINADLSQTFGSIVGIQTLKSRVY